MPRLEGFYEYRFVVPGWTHPLGYKIEYPTDILGLPISDEVIDAIAQRQEAFATELERQFASCDHSLCHRSFGEWSCQRRARTARDATRTDDRTVLVKVFIPVDNQ